MIFPRHLPLLLTENKNVVNYMQYFWAQQDDIPEGMGYKALWFKKATGLLLFLSVFLQEFIDGQRLGIVVALKIAAAYIPHHL